MGYKTVDAHSNRRIAHTIRAHTLTAIDAGLLGPLCRRDATPAGARMVPYFIFFDKSSSHAPSRPSLAFLLTQ